MTRCGVVPDHLLDTLFQREVVALKDGLKRFATGTYLVWLPFLPTIEARALPGKLKKLPADWDYASLTVRGPATKGRGMNGSAVFIINPPWPLKAALEKSLLWLTQVLAVNDKAEWDVESSDTEAVKPRGDSIQ